MAKTFSIELEFENGSHITYDNIVSYTVEDEEDPDEIPEDGDEEREGNTEPDMAEENNPMMEEEEK